ncbi:ANTAR domain-containing protein [Streptomyces sp. WAC00263]|uniref:ANTAR domain-containing protein n=1 Tax=Streptomyces sp. WAC00263 TaxID=1917422 RepID=UPI0015EFBA22|nr:hypothetical protein BOG92_051385 [Streptomyces sp. WAC00263]
MERVEELQVENAQLQEAMRSHAVVDQAIGVVLAIGGLTPEQGWEVLKEISQRTNIKLRRVAELIVEWARTGYLCADIRSELERQIAQHTPPSTPAPEHTEHTEHTEPASDTTWSAERAGRPRGVSQPHRPRRGLPSPHPAAGASVRSGCTPRPGVLHPPNI